MTEAAWLVYAIFCAYLCGFLLLTGRTGRLTGRSPWLFAQGARLQRLTGLAFKASFALAASWPLLLLAKWSPSVPDGWWSAPLAWTGVLLAAAGASFALLCQTHMGQSWRIGAMDQEQGELVKDGPFAWSRNPVFLGQILLMWAIPVATGLVALTVPAALFTAAAVVQARIEERALIASLGERYRRYMDRVPRWFGRRSKGDRPVGPIRMSAALSIVGVLSISAAIDQGSKWLILNVVMQPPRVIEILPFFNLTLGFNTGVTFGFLGDAMAERQELLILLSVGIVLAIAVWAMKAAMHSERIGLAMVAGGATGNIVDRWRRGAVTDFLDFHFGGWHWPAFNMADVFIVLGVTVLLIGGLATSLVRSRVGKSL